MSDQNVPYKKEIEQTLKEIGVLTDKLFSYGSELSDNFKIILRGGKWELTIVKRK